MDDIKLCYSLPDKIKIGHTVYDVREMSDTEYRVSDTPFGLTDKEAKKISVRLKNVSNEEVANTVLHEILHALYEFMYLEVAVDSKDPEEYVVNMMANGLSMVMADNPEVFQEMLDVFSQDRLSDLSKPKPTKR